jgi:hypothetical protein
MPATGEDVFVNQRSFTQWLGAALLVSAVGAFVFGGVPPLLLGVQMVLLAVAGVLFFAGGVTDSVRWGLLAGLGNIALGASLVVNGLGDTTATGGELLFTGALVVGGLILVLFGVLYVVDYDAIDTEP